MRGKAYCAVSSLVFAAVAVAHGVRAARGMSLVIDGRNVSLGVSWLAVVVAVLLSLWGLSLALGRAERP